MIASNIYSRLADIHDELMPQYTDAAIQEAQEAGQHNPCGCSICLLMDTVLAEQIGAMVATEPQPVWTPKDIKKNLNELAALRARCRWAEQIVARGVELMPLDQLGQWDGVAAWQATGADDYGDVITDLSTQIAQLEDLCEMHSANLQRYAARELEHNRRAADLRTKLAVAQAELRELRCRVLALTAKLVAERLRIVEEVQRVALQQVEVNDLLAARLVAAQERIRQLEEATEWEPASGHIQSTDSDDTLTVDGRWLVVNAGSLKNIAIRLPDGYCLMRKRQEQES